MTTFRFITNLRPETVASFERSRHEPQAWLLSSHRLTTETEGYAREFRDAGVDVFADNGTKPLIDLATRQFATRLAPLRAKIRSLRRSLPDHRRVPRPSEVPDSLRDEASDAAHRVADMVDDIVEAEPVEVVLEQQSRMNPSHLIAKEDFAVGVMLSLGLDRDVTGMPVSFFNRRNRRTVEFWERAVSDHRCRDVAVYATLSAVDYNTSYAAARLFAAAGIERVAVGYAGINRDPNFCRSFQIGHRSLMPGSAPRRYVRGLEIALGVADGYRHAGRRLRAFHGLGLGATAQYPVLASAFDWFTHLSVDATSPLQDSVNDLVFYDDTAHGDRVDVVEAAERILNGGTWSFASPFCQYLRHRFGHHPTNARHWWATVDHRPVTRDDLHPQQPLGDILGVFASARGGSSLVQQRGRTGHNHWVCDLLAAEIPSSRRAEWARDRIRLLIGHRRGSTRHGLAAADFILDDHQVRRDRGDIP